MFVVVVVCCLIFSFQKYYTIMKQNNDKAHMIPLAHITAILRSFGHDLDDDEVYIIFYLFYLIFCFCFVLFCFLIFPFFF